MCNWFLSLSSQEIFIKHDMLILPFVNHTNVAEITTVYCSKVSIFLLVMYKSINSLRTIFTTKHKFKFRVLLNNCHNFHQ